jgi:putative hydrolase of HD superfamily
MSYPSIDRIAELQQFIADFAKVKRAIHLADNGLPENDVEHSFGLAMTCWYLHEKIAPELDLEKIFKYALSHDVVEVHAGDTYVFDKKAVATKQKRERDAMEQLKQEWKDFTDLTEFTEGYADKRSNEAKFVYAVDKMLPLIIIELHDAKRIWDDKQVTLEMERENKKTMLTSEIIAPYYEKILRWLDERDNIPKK